MNEIATEPLVRFPGIFDLSAPTLVTPALYVEELKVSVPPMHFGGTGGDSDGDGDDGDGDGGEGDGEGADA